MNFTTRIGWILAVGLLIPILIGINAHRTTERMVSQNRLLIHTHLVLQKTQQIQAHLTNLDNDLRGYLLSQNNPFFKADYDRNVRQMAGFLKNIAALTVDNPAQQQRLRTISQLFEQKLAHGNILFTKRSPQEGLARLDSVRTFMGFSDQLFHQLKTIEAVENELLTVRATASEQSATYATRSSIAGAVAALAIILWAIFRLLKTLNNATRLNRQLAQNEQQLKRFLEAVPVSIVVVNKDGDLYYANQAAATMFEAITKLNTYADILKQITIYQFPNGNPYPTEKRPAFRAMKGETSQVDDIEVRIGDKAIQILSSSSPVYDAEGMLQYVVSSSIDISDRVQSQLRLQEAKELAEQAARIKENFLANMSHEIRTPLNAVIGFSNLLEVTPLNEEQAEFVKLVQTAGKNLLTIVNDILDISKIEAGMIQMESIPFSIRSLVASLQTMLQPTAADKNLKLVFDVDPTLPPLVLGDPTRLTQILLNLLSNAIKFTKEGSITAQITRQEETEQSVRVQFKVTDTGIGIEADALPHIFERFRQASNFTTRYYGGTGLGLNIVKSLTQIQGGWITVTSKPGKGSEFTLEIPYQIAPESVRKGIDPDLTKTNAVKKSLTILAVEDNLMNQKLVLQVIKRLGYKAELAENGQQALDMLQKESFDLILMDIQMPVMDGYQTTRHIRTTLQSNIPIIAMTAHALASEREQCLQAGMNDFLPKPFQMEDLQRMIQHYGFPNGEQAPVVETSRPVHSIDSTSFSVEPLLNSVGNDAELAMELLEIYLDKTPDEIKQLQQALSDGDVKAIGRTLHTQKAPAMMMGLEEATELNLKIEALVKADKDITAVAPLLEQYITVVEAGLPAIHTALQNGTNQD
ncbi:hybrid sensor histidine kinase/response regulator [Spirosoma endbachense]|uniref:hybrid sensor histidine kinase/response regulator n=1 Tax=Spirosoma endbachense TaxID=2666025 RepID=UPI001E483101|nr:response regulator [Spirosoma endbachense]